MYLLKYLAIGIVVIGACQSQPKQAPFKANAPQAVAPAPETSTEPKTSSKDHILGTDSYPCEAAICKVPSPADGTLATTGAGAKSIDPNLVSESAGSMIIANIFEGLINYDVGNGPVRPGVAKRWDISADGKTYTFHLRDNAKWSNGRTVDAHDFVYSWIRKLTPALASVSAEHHFYIKNARGFNAGKITDPKQVGIKAKDRFTLEVTLENPTPFFMQYLVSPHYAPVPKEAVEKHGKVWTRAENIVTNGPYHLSKWAHRDKLVLTKSSTYWDHKNVRIPRVIIHHSESQHQDLTRYKARQTQWHRTQVPTDLIQKFISEGRSDFFIDPRLCIYYYALRMDKPPFDDVRVRQAFEMAIDKETLVNQITLGKQAPADGPVPVVFDSTHHFPGTPGRSFDPEAAKALLRQAGYGKDKKLPKITLIYNTYESHRKIAEFVQRSLREHLEVEIEIDNMEWKSLLQRLNAGDYQMARYGWCGIADPWGFLQYLRSTSTNNRMGYKNPEVDAIFERSLKTLDRAARMKLLAEAERQIIEDAAIIPMYYYTNNYLKLPVLRGLKAQVSDMHLFKYMYWGDKEQTKP